MVYYWELGSLSDAAVRPAKSPVRLNRRFGRVLYGGVRIGLVARPGRGPQMDEDFIDGAVFIFKHYQSPLYLGFSRVRSTRGYIGFNLYD